MMKKTMVILIGKNKNEDPRMMFRVEIIDAIIVTKLILVIRLFILI
jgi:hypothetical protein